MHDELPKQYGSHGFLISLVVVAVLAIGFSFLLKVRTQVGTPFPVIEAAGWINGSGPTAEELRGHVMVVDAWAYWCGPCRKVTPMLIELQKKYGDRGVVFVGLTSEGTDSESIKLSREFVEEEQVPWPNGYGAAKTLSALEVEGIPQFWVVDRQNRIVFHEIGWDDNSMYKMEQSLIKALQEP